MPWNSWIVLRIVCHYASCISRTFRKGVHILPINCKSRAGISQGVQLPSIKSSASTFFIWMITASKQLWLVPAIFILSSTKPSILALLLGLHSVRHLVFHQSLKFLLINIQILLKGGARLFWHLWRLRIKYLLPFLRYYIRPFEPPLFPLAIENDIMDYSSIWQFTTFIYFKSLYNFFLLFVSKFYSIGP